MSTETETEKTYNQKFILDYLLKNKEKYNTFFHQKTKTYKKPIFLAELDKNLISTYKSQKLAITLNIWNVSNNQNIPSNKIYTKKHNNAQNGWTISGRIVEDYVSYVPIFTAYHQKYGYITGNFTTKIHSISSYNKNDEAIKHFLSNNLPLVWNEWDI